ncbi:hypothetical protein HN958_02800 [Candidatus Falkowbacteria bacterium]|jgi:hypothetical protein|nr:hypothetical protein [Candidatus Falkowbacteria bacterium]MBT7007408.1 hypothetical protein [Candidatus Falkowbacteria bacterium]
MFIDLGFVQIDLSWIDNLGGQPFYVIMWHFFVNGGWILFVVAFIWGAWKNYVFLQVRKFAGKQKYVLLAIDVPKNNYQTPKAVENIFTALAGADMPMAWFEKNIKGEFQLEFSFEIVSIDGYLQFLVRTPSQFRDLVEAAIYSQYPEAELTEVEDYAEAVDTTFPDDEYNLWGADLVLVKDDCIPIKTYREFEDMSSKEFKDPMAALLEIMGKIGKGEQIWFQMIAAPADIGWQKSGEKAIKKILQIPEKTKMTTVDKILNAPLDVLSRVGDEVFKATGGELGPEEKPAEFSMLKIPPHEQALAEAIGHKIDKIMYDCKGRIIYYGKKEVFRKGLAVSGTIGAIKQFTSTELNAFKPGNNKTQSRIWAVDYRNDRKKNKILTAYKDRNAWTGKGPYMLNSEELATVFHFPDIEVQAPLVKKVEARKSMAPVGLPTDQDAADVGFDDLEEDASSPEMDVESDVTPAIDYDNDYFEERFAIDKTGESDKKRKEEVLQKIKAGDIKNASNEKVEIKSEVDDKFSIEDNETDEAPVLDEKTETKTLPTLKVKQEKESSDSDEEDSPSNLPFV